jgi:uncharacterized protein YndB with AHSA1/START domain
MTSPEQTERTEHRIERTYEVAATPEQVWEAIATAGGISAWMVPTQLDPRVGGEVSFDLGDFTSTGVVTAYEPVRRFAYEEPWPLPSECDEQWMAEHGGITDVDATSVGPLATEFLVEAASGGSCVIRVVSSSYGSGADWEHEFFTEMAQGWIELLDQLPAHLVEAA